MKKKTAKKQNKTKKPGKKQKKNQQKTLFSSWNSVSH